MQVSECASMNKLHFLHEYRDISAWIIVLAFDGNIQKATWAQARETSQRGAGVRGWRGVRPEMWQDMKCVIWKKRWQRRLMCTSVSAPRTHFNTNRWGRERRLPGLKRKNEWQKGGGRLWEIMEEEEMRVEWKLDEEVKEQQQGWR